MDTTLRRTVPFLLSQSVGESAVFMLDQVVLPPGRVPGDALLTKIASSLDLTAIGSLLPEDVVADIVAEQYEVCLEYIYSHPLWAAFRSGKGSMPLLAYLLETRHYLHAAASRMAPGVAANWHDGSLTLLLAHHVVEEADHARYFEEALLVLECSPQIVQACRPSPVTLEWIYLMRVLATTDPLVAAICSGLMESSAAARDAVRNWHEMLIQNKLLPESSVRSIWQHVQTDIELGHGANWREAIKYQSPITPVKLKDCLNSVCAIAEMIVRWLDSLQNNVSGHIVQAMSGMKVALDSSEPEAIDLIFNGLPVWPAEILHHVTHSSGLSDSVREVIGTAYHLDLNQVVSRKDSQVEIVEQASKITEQLPAKSVKLDTVDDLYNVLRSWLCSIDGHWLWTEMTEQPNLSLVYGWLLENYFYIGAACRHVSAAIAACPDPLIRHELLKHLHEEAEHAQVLKVGLDAVASPIPVQLCRPLPTTLAFVGYIRELAASDWKAYCLALGYLQFSLRKDKNQHNNFYETVTVKCPEALPLLNAMRTHDGIDENMGHEDDILQLLSLLYKRHAISQETLGRAAIVAQLAWSFLDGIRCHYTNGSSALAQRLGWSANGSL